MRNKKQQMPALEDDPRRVFCEFLEQVFKHDPDIHSARGMWKIHCEGEANYAARWLLAFDQMLRSARQNFLPLLRSHGHIQLIHYPDTPDEKDFSQDEVMAWITEVFHEFENYFYAHTRYEK